VRTSAAMTRAASEPVTCLHTREGRPVRDPTRLSAGMWPIPPKFFCSERTLRGVH
jgi:hypothetical protein